MNFGNEQYIAWQKRLARFGVFRYFWQFASNYSWLLLVPVGWYFIYYATNKYVAVEIILAFVVARFIVVPIISFFWPKPRPYQIYNFIPVTSRLLSWQTEKQNSFPSRHVICLAAATGVLVTSWPIWLLLFFPITIMTAIGRVILGYHYPKDVIGAIIFGLIIGIIVALLV